MEIKNTKKLQELYSSPEMNVFYIATDKIFCASPIGAGTESFGIENSFEW